MILLCFWVHLHNVKLTAQTLFIIYIFCSALICVQQAPVCENGGTCHEEDGDVASCTCDVGYTGDNCETREFIFICKVLYKSKVNYTLALQKCN